MGGSKDPETGEALGGGGGGLFGWLRSPTAQDIFKTGYGGLATWRNQQQQNAQQGGIGGGPIMAGQPPYIPPPPQMPNPFAPAIDPNTGLPLQKPSAAMPYSTAEMYQYMPTYRGS